MIQSWTGGKKVMKSDTSDYLFDLARSDARGAYISVLDFSVNLNGDTLQVRQPSTFRHIMGVADFISHDGTFTTDIAFPTHCLDLP